MSLTENILNEENIFLKIDLFVKKSPDIAGNFLNQKNKFKGMPLVQLYLEFASPEFENFKTIIINLYHRNKIEIDGSTYKQMKDSGLSGLTEKDIFEKKELFFIGNFIKPNH